MKKVMNNVFAVVFALMMMLSVVFMAAGFIDACSNNWIGVIELFGGIALCAGLFKGLEPMMDFIDKKFDK